MAAADGDANSKFSAALTSSLEDFIHKSLKDEQTECIRRIVYLEEDVSAILPMQFGKSVISVDSKSDERIASFIVVHLLL